MFFFFQPYYIFGIFLGNIFFSGRQFLVMVFHCFPAKRHLCFPLLFMGFSINRSGLGCSIAVGCPFLEKELFHFFWGVSTASTHLCGIHHCPYLVIWIHLSFLLSRTMLFMSFCLGIYIYINDLQKNERT